MPVEMQIPLEAMARKLIHAVIDDAKESSRAHQSRKCQNLKPGLEGIALGRAYRSVSVLRNHPRTHRTWMMLRKLIVAKTPSSPSPMSVWAKLSTTQS
ncbi:hypothetical protein IG631_19962 [Alternaria alternata]|nr:hypothetical protein IG631_19962 [Alternaria alternata]